MTTAQLLNELVKDGEIIVISKDWIKLDREGNRIVPNRGKASEDGPITITNSKYGTSIPFKIDLGISKYHLKKYTFNRILRDMIKELKNWKD